MARPLAAGAATTESTRNRGAIMVAAVSGVLSAVLIFAYLSSQSGSGDGTPAAPTDGSSETVVTLSHDVQVGDKIVAEWLTTQVIPKNLLIVGHVTDLQSVVGKVATAPMLTGEQVVAGKVTTYEGQNSLAYKIPDGLRALSLQVPHEAWAAAGLPQPGDRVDILGITTLTRTDPLTGQERPDVLTGIIAQDVEILAIAQTLVKTVPNTDAQKKNADGTSAPVAAQVVPASTTKDGKPLAAPDTYEKAISITVALPPDLAAKVALIDALKDEVAQYRILPRQKGDAQPINGKVTWTFDDIFDLKKK